MPEKLNSSFRDPSGYMYLQDGEYFRAVSPVYKDNYDYLLSSGLADKLVENGMMLPFEEVGTDSALGNDNVYKIIRPEQLSHVSYPYEWCFSQLKDAALMTLDIHREALSSEMSLKDASAYNVQFHNGKPVFIDTLSFEKFEEGKPWVAYQQFCQHFLAPLVLASYVDVTSLKLSRLYIDGIPLDYAAKQLPLRARVRPSIYIHLVLHAKSQVSHADDNLVKKRNISKNGLLGLIDNLRNLVQSLTWGNVKTEWGDYYSDTNYSDLSVVEKREVIGEMLEEVSPSTVWDFGGNTGEYSRLASMRGIDTLSFDVDYLAIEKSYLRTVEGKEAHISQFVMDLTNPSSDLGWNNRERMSLVRRGPADATMALALIHHLCISNNLPLEHVVEFFRAYTRNHLIIEFVPKSDSQVKRLLSTREDIFVDYVQENFEREFKVVFDIIKAVKISNTERTIYLMKKRGGEHE